MVDPEFPRRGRQPLRWGQKHYFARYLPKTHENEGNWTGGGGSARGWGVGHAPLTPIGSTNALSIVFVFKSQFLYLDYFTQTTRVLIISVYFLDQNYRRKTC